MFVRVLLGAVASALALLLWGFLFWVVLSAPGGALRAVPDEAGLMQTLRERLPASGSYAFPSPPAGTAASDPAALEAFRQRNLAGPMGIIHFRRTGTDPLSPRNYAKDFLHLLAASFVAALLLAAVLPALETYARRAAFVFGLGVFAAVAVRLYDPVWWHLPWRHFAYSALYDCAAWLISGLVLGGIVKPSRGVPHLTDPRLPLWRRALDVD
jgi:hypothetical protein